MSQIRRKIVDRMAGEIHEYLAGLILPGAGSSDEVWAAVAEADVAMMEAGRAFERGEIDHATLEAAGVEYVEAWSAAVEELQGEPA